MKKQSKQKQESPKEKTINHVLLGLIIALLAIIVFSSIFYLRASRPRMQAKQEAIEIAKKYADETSAKFINGVLSQFVTDEA